MYTYLQANLQVELTSASNDVLASLGNPRLYARVGLGETLETLDQLGEIAGVLDLNGDLDDRGHGELHDLHVVCRLGCCEGTALQQELVDTDETDDVTSRAVLNGLDVTTHHEDGTLHRLDEKVILLARDVVRSLDTDLGAGADRAREDTAEGVEAALVGSRHHLGDVGNERTVGVTVADTNGRLIVHRTLVEGLDTVALSSGRRGKVNDNHLQEGVAGGEELPHDDLEERLALEITLVLSELDVELLTDLADFLLLEVHDGVEDAEDGVKDKDVEGTFEGLAASVGALCRPLLSSGVEEVVAPELYHHLVLVDTEFLRVTRGELAESEAPTVETGTKGNGTLFRVNLNITKSLVVVSGDDDVDAFDGTREGLEEVLL